MEKEYIVTVTLKDGTKTKIQEDYNWGYENEANDTRKQFIEIEKSIFNKEYIVSITTEKNPEYKKEEEQEEE